MSNIITADLESTLVLEDITAILGGRQNDLRFTVNQEFDGHEIILYASDSASGLRAFIAVHNTNRGPALGGCRYYDAYDNDDAAITDVLRLSRGMTYKNATAGLDLGGGKCVIVGPSGQDKPTAPMMRALGRAVQSLGGRYVTAEDMNTSEADMEAVMEETPYVSGVPFAKFASALLPAGFDQASLPGANPSPYTAYGTYVGIRAAVLHRMGKAGLEGVTVAVKGAAGAVASELCRLLYADGALLIVSDWDGNAKAQTRLQQLATQCGAKVTTSERIMQETADVYAPCARGGDLDDASIPLLKAGIVAGCANNVLAAPRHAEALKARGILYAPDYVINAGGVICAGTQYLWKAHPELYAVPTHQEVLDRAGQIYETLQEIFRRSDAENKNTALIADRLAEERFAARPALTVAA